MPTSTKKRLTSNKNFVKEAAKIQINIRPTKKKFIPGVYTQHQ